MFIRTLGGLETAGRIKSLVKGTTRSARFLTTADGMGFSYNDNRVTKGSDAKLWYKHHWEANYIISGRGELTDLSSGRKWPLSSGALYVVGPNDRHRFRVTEDEHHVSIFYPPLRGDEGHDRDGGYAANTPGPRTERRLFVKYADEMRQAGHERVAVNGHLRTLRMLTQEDDVGFGFSDVHLIAGSEVTCWYMHHWEANHVLTGSGQVTDLASGESWKLEPGVAYNVGPGDRYTLRALSDLHLVSIFSPALKGNELHDSEGTLVPSGPVPPGPGAG
jgi:L-ectoine synthase